MWKKKTKKKINNEHNILFCQKVPSDYSKTDEKKKNNNRGQNERNEKFDENYSRNSNKRNLKYFITQNK